ncbi:hypothetical protein DGE88_10295 [Aliarcobacter skirrowii]|nr:hypothetical protein DGE88_10295 [Aliarcobacter skirrowii]
MRFAKGKKILTQSDILDFLININDTKQVNLPHSELNQIANSVIRYWQNGTIRYGELKDKEKNVNEGAMEFEKMRNLSYDEYLEETKRRQQKAAIRTLELRDKKKNKQQLLVAKEMYMRKLQEEKESSVICAILDLEEKGLKVNVATISRIAKVDRRTAKKYFLAYGKN